jgi:TonB family protein
VSGSQKRFSRRRRSDGPGAVATVAWALSLAAHCGLVLWGATLLLDRDVEPTPPTPPVTRLSEPIPVLVDILPIQPPPAVALVPARADALVASEAERGGEHMARPDAQHAGRGGERRVTLPAVNMSPRDDHAHLSRAERSRIDRAQEARQRTGSGRQSMEDDTVTPRPTVLTFWADGSGQRFEPRRWADVDPSAGRLGSGAAMATGFGAGRSPKTHFGDATNRKLAGNGDPGNADRSSAGAGVLDGDRGYRVVHDADVGSARPMAISGAVSTRGDERGPQQDDVDSEQEVVRSDPSLLAASTAGGEAGSGRGGETGPGKTGSGGIRGPGSNARPMGDGRGPGSAFDPADARRRTFLRGMRARLHGAWSPNAFPKWAALQGRGGATVVGFVVLADGSVTNVRTLRPSGFPEFDAKMRAAVRRAAPFGSPPSDLSPPFNSHHEFAVTNPAVRPTGR